MNTINSNYCMMQSNFCGHGRCRVTGEDKKHIINVVTYLGVLWRWTYTVIKANNKFDLWMQIELTSFLIYIYINVFQFNFNLILLTLMPSSDNESFLIFTFNLYTATHSIFLCQYTVFIMCFFYVDFQYFHYDLFKLLL